MSILIAYIIGVGIPVVGLTVFYGMQGYNNKPTTAQKRLEKMIRGKR